MRILEKFSRWVFFGVTSAALVCLLSLKSFAEEPQFTASVDKQSVRVNEEVHLNVRVVGIRGSIQAPHLPSLEGFEIFYSGRASRFSFINNQSESLTEFNYVLIPRSAGRFVLQPIEIRVDERVYRTNQVEIMVEQDQMASPAYPTARPTSIGPSSSMSPSGATRFPSQSPSATPLSPAGPISKSELDENIFLKVRPTQLTVYQNQQLILTYSLYTRYDTRYEGFIEEPETSGFWIEEFPMEQNLGRDTEVVEGKRYVRADIKKLALFPTSPGQYVIKPGTIKASVQIEDRNSTLFDEFFNDSFFTGGGFFARRVERQLAHPPIQIQVKALPEAGKPASFKGAVGEFRMATSLDKRVVNQNEALTFRIALEGEGNIETLQAPAFPEIAGVKIYESDTKTELFRAQNRIAGKKTFEIVVIPTEAGELTIPSLEFSFFNPKIENYTILKSDTYKVRVNRSSSTPPVIPKDVSQADLAETKKSIRLEAEDIQYIKEPISVSRGPLQSLLLFGLASLDAVLTLSFLGFVALRRRSEYLERNIPKKRTLFAKKNANRGLKQLNRRAKTAARDPKSLEHFFEESAKILNQYLSDKLNVSPQGLTLDLVAHRLEERRADPGVIQKISDCYEISDRVRFGRTVLEGVDSWSMIQQIREIIELVERL